MRRPPSAALVAVLVLAAIAGGRLAAPTPTFAAFAGTTSNPSTFGAATLAPPTSLSVRQVCIPTTSIVQTRTPTVATGNGGNVTVAAPTGVVAGELMVAHVGIRSGSATITDPGGWTLVRQDANVEVTQAVYTKVASASEPSTYKWTSNTSGRVAAGVGVYSGVSSAVAVEVTSAGSGIDTSMAAPSVTTQTRGTMLLALFTLRQVTMTLPTGMAERWNVGSGGGAGSVTVGAADETFAGSGATGSRVATASSALDWVAGLVALRPRSDPSVALAWTATTSAFATGYRRQRWVGTTQQGETTITPASVVSDSDTAVAIGTTYSYRLFSYHQSWTSTHAVASIGIIAC